MAENLSRRTVLVGLAGIAGLALAGCTQGQGNPSPTGGPQGGTTPPVTPQPSPTTTPAVPVDTTPRWPLTGVPLAAGEDTKAAHPAVAVKVPVEKRSFPQSGVQDADLVFVEAQGDSYDITRLCAVFHSKFPKDGANPVRSTRPVDVALLSPIKPVLACTGAVKWVLKYVHKNKSNIELREKYGDTSDRWKYLPSRGGWLKGGAMPDKSVVAMPAALSRDAKISKDTIPPVYLPYNLPGEQPSSASGTAAKQVTVTFDGQGTEYHRWTWDAKDERWVASIRFQESSQWYDWKTREGKRVGADNVMVLFCAWRMGVLKGYSGHHEPIYSIIDGADKFLYFHDGKQVSGTWKKGGLTDRFEFTLDDGTPLKLAPGKTWILMPNHDAPVKIS